MKSRQAARNCGEYFRLSSSPFTLAMMDVASTATPFVSRISSPTRAPAVRTSRSFATSPSICPTTIGRSSPYVTSVCPPQSVMRYRRQAAASCAKIASTIASVVLPSGNSNVAKNHFGVAPRVAKSFALITIAYQPMSSATNVIGSVLATRYAAPMSITAASSPISGPTITRGSAIVTCACSSRRNCSNFSFPTGRGAFIIRVPPPTARRDG